MSLHPPRYSLPPPTLRPHSARVGVVLSTAFRERLTGINIALLVLVYLVVVIPIVFSFFFRGLFAASGNVSELSVFYAPYPGQAWFFFEVLFTASVGAGIVANDLSTRAITMYLARPITALDYLAAKSAAVALWLGVVAIAPALLGTTIVLALGYVSLPIALEAVAGYLAAGLLTVAAFGGLAIWLSSLAPKSSFAGAAIFGILVGSEVVAGVLYAISGSAGVLYLSPQDDVLAVAQYAFGAGGAVINPAAAAGILVGLAGLTLFLAYQRLATIDAVAE